MNAKRILTTLAAAGGALLLHACKAMAFDGFKAPKLSDTYKESLPWMAYLYAIVAAAAVCVVAFKNSKRTHLD